MEPNTTVAAESGFEFNEEQNATIKSLSTSMRWVGAVMLVIGALQCIAGVLTVAKGGLPSLLQGFILIVFAVFTYKAAYAFRRIVDSAGQDITHLMTAICSLRNLYRLQVILLALAALLLIVSFGIVGISSFAR
jgi:hypothetical protein